MFRFSFGPESHILLCTTLLCFVHVCSYGADAPGTQWSLLYGGNADDASFVVQQTADGGFVVAGYTASFGSSPYDGILIKIDDQGTVQWRQTYHFRGSEQIKGVQQTPDGGYILAGITSSGSMLDDIYVVKTDADGIPVWQKTFGGSGFEDGMCVKVLANGDYLVVGETRSFGDSNGDVYVVNFDIDGNRIWEKYYPSPGWNKGNSFVQTSDGGFLIVGSTSQSDIWHSDIYLIRLDPTGAKVWDNHFGGYLREMGNDIEKATGGYLIVGDTYSSGSGGQDAFVLKVDESGHKIWEKTFGSPFDDTALNLTATTDGDFVIVGTKGAASELYNFWIQKINIDGQVIWEKSLGGSRDDAFNCIVQTVDEGFAVSGWTDSYGSARQIYVLRLLPENRIPVALCKNVIVPAGEVCRAMVTAADIDSGSYDPDADSIFLVIEPSGPFDLGETVVTLTVTDTHGAFDQCTSLVTVIDKTAPVPDVADLPEARGECNMTLTPPSATDNCAGVVNGTTTDPLTYESQGVYTVTWFYDDSNGNISEQTQKVVVKDTTTPILNVTSNPITLWPPNHKYIQIDLDQLVLLASDNCESVVLNDVIITRVTSDEVEDLAGNGDGNTNRDIVIADDCKSVNLRQERQGAGNGRVYSIHLALPDGNGNTAEAICKVQVPHNQGETAIDDGMDAFIVLGNCSEAIHKLAYRSPGEEEQLPDAFVLHQNHPNPANPSTQITFSLPEESEVDLTIYNSFGQVVRSLVTGQMSAGTHAVIWEGDDDSGMRISSGVYIYVMQAGTAIDKKKLLLLK